MWRVANTKRDGNVENAELTPEPYVDFEVKHSRLSFCKSVFNFTQRDRKTSLIVLQRLRAEYCS